MGAARRRAGCSGNIDAERQHRPPGGAAHPWGGGGGAVLGSDAVCPAGTATQHVLALMTMYCQPVAGDFLSDGRAAAATGGWHRGGV